MPAPTEGGSSRLRRSIALRLAATETLASLIHGHEFATLTPILYAGARELAASGEVTVPKAYAALVSAHNRICRSPVTGSALRAARWVRRRRVLRRLKHAVSAAHWAPPEVEGGVRSPDLVTGGAPPEVSVVMLVRDRKEYHQRTLDSLHRWPAGRPFELVMVDNGSTDGSTELLREAALQGRASRVVLVAENQGSSGGFNLGFHFSDPRSRYLMKLDSDICMLSAGWLERALAAFEGNRDVGLVSLRQRNHVMMHCMRFARRGASRLAPMLSWPCGSAMVLNRSVFERLGELLELPGERYVLDDVDYCMRVERLGLEAVVVWDVLVHHQIHLDGNQADPARDERVMGAIRRMVAVAREYDSGTRPLLQHPERAPGWPGTVVREVVTPSR